ncbi:hypothetical protein ANO11243_049470 [Dothideomycetidae sp. 11243]|nr:hypothetical protein ANO11243_049470 [fungal sp. No.11243]
MDCSYSEFEEAEIKILLIDDVRKAIRKSPVVKVVGLFKRKPGLSFAEFRDYYENRHCQLYDEHVSQPGVLRYARRYLTPMSGLASAIANPTENSYDVIMEVWYANKEVMKELFSKQDPGFSKKCKEDEAKLFDQGSMTMYISEDYETKDGPWNASE